MFELPDAKRVRRQDLYDSASERHSSPEGDDEEKAEIRAKLNARLSNLLSLGPIEVGNVADDDGADGADEANDQPPDDGEFEFRLFSTSGPSHKVLLATEETHQGPPISERPISYYVRGDLAPEEKERLRFSAVSGSDVMAASKQRAWGLEVPWRVTKIVISAGRRKGEQGGERIAEESQGRKRPGKKRRITLRIKEKAAKEAAAAKAEKLMTKEEHLREKKKRLNREKKLKRRKKEKEAKMALRGEGGDLGAESSGAESDASE
ncbi:hypothetical protein B0T25DRAFT_534502 [Lasiosphaeria hispida]|uniref:Uncharacterized protein n=1 Tax=Lasiosphaeria hispida TaxID=260671 RepID=A0AAJ0MIG5_9PEZI|nr:hypothetical protein B0T25DRAFT_534502 [Lasiosphaeria hispida]